MQLLRDRLAEVVPGVLAVLGVVEPFAAVRDVLPPLECGVEKDEVKVRRCEVELVHRLRVL